MPNDSFAIVICRENDLLKKKLEVVMKCAKCVECTNNDCIIKK